MFLIDLVHTGNEAVLISMAECFDVSTITDEDGSSESAYQDLCMAQTIFGLPDETPTIRKSQGFLFNLLAMAASAPDGVSLASNKSAEGLIDGLRNILQHFYKQYLQSEADASLWDVEEPLPFNIDHDEKSRRDIAKAYCALRVLSELSRTETNKSRLFLRVDILQIFTSMLTCKTIHRVFMLSILEALGNGSSLLSANSHPEALLSLLKALLVVLENSTGLDRATGISTPHTSEPVFDSDISRRVLHTLCSCSPEWGLDAAFVPTFMTIVARLLFLQHNVNVLESVAELALNLATAYPKVAGDHDTFVPGILQLLHSGQCLDFAVETLCTVHSAHPLHAYKDEMRGLCQWQLLSDTQVHSLAKILEPLVGSPDELFSPTEHKISIKRGAEQSDQERRGESTNDK